LQAAPEGLGAGLAVALAAEEATKTGDHSIPIVIPPDCFTLWVMTARTIATA